MTYAEQLLDPHWLERRDEIIERDWRMCQQCMSSRNLQVHHKHYYNDGRMAWQYPGSELITLCAKCHAEIHKDGYQVPTITPDPILDAGERLREALKCLCGLIEYTNHKKKHGKEVH